MPSAALTSLFTLDGTRALVTGAHGGLGRAQALALGQAGAEIVATDLTTERAEQACAHLRRQGVRALPLALDVTSVDSIEAAFDDLERRGHVPDVVVNNAGVSLRNAALDATAAEFDLTLGVNLRGTYFVAQRAARAMRPRGGGRIINLASIGGLVVDGERSSVYDASKAAVVQLTKNLAYEWGGDGIRVNAIAPGYMRTEMTADLMPTRDAEDELVARHIPLGRVGEPGDLAGAVVFLASAASAYVTGHTLTVDGGWVVSL
ncbi:2-dehydro-3-deoxy-D-gluconate 5-dehydrogenase [Micromonospora sp. MW-13]|uniref:SDR family NAD(P)-dependent oxidoreductase n=1 Tax=Micromonospora sp. MW-13 TaxID=2094022 RepID=UPI000E448BAA|nr:glucose 1-dehydrogenase [Micromonospora sp. MW-13]RGC69273.1 2-dehydro-3-deoxy-D-gluconate 5-dehydrogenase [Micromonospora sp. MW-13]